MPKKGEVSIIEERCKGCNICATYCPKKILGLREDGKMEVKDPGNCIACDLCELRCPDYAIKVEVKENNE